MISTLYDASLALGESVRQYVFQCLIRDDCGRISVYASRISGSHRRQGMSAKSIEIICSECGEDTFVKHEPVYEGFKKTGDRIVCVACGYEYASEEVVPYKEKKLIQVFSESDRPNKSDLFSDDAEVRNCRRCGHYVLNPFVQRCGLHHKLVEATDTCDKFERKEEEEETDDG